MATDYLVGTKANQVPTCGDLGSLAFQNADDVVLDNLLVSNRIELPGPISLDTSGSSGFYAAIQMRATPLNIVKTTNGFYSVLELWPYVYSMGTGTTNTIYGINNEIRLMDTGFTNITNLLAKLECAIPHTLTSYHGVFVASPGLIGTGTTLGVTTYYGCYVDGIETISASTAYGFRTDIVSGVNQWGFYNYGGADNYLGSGDTSTSSTGTLSFGSNTRQMINLYSTLYGFGVQSLTTYVRTHRNFDIHVNGVHSDAEHDPGTGGYNIASFRYVTTTDCGLSLYGSLGVNTLYSATATLKIDDAVGANGTKYGLYSNFTVTDEDLTANRSQYGTYLQLNSSEDGVLGTQKSISNITWSNGIATVTCNAHGLSTSNNIIIFGAIPYCYSGDFTITVIDANTFTIPIPVIITTATTTTNSATLTGATGAFRNITVGMQITGTNIPANTYVSSWNSNASITISQAATGSGSITATFNPGPYGYSYSAISCTTTVSSTSLTCTGGFNSLTSGMSVTGPNIAAGTTIITIIDDTHLTLSQNALASSTQSTTFSKLLSSTNGVVQKAHGFTQSIYGQQTRVYNSYTFNVTNCTLTSGSNIVTSTNDFTNILGSNQSLIHKVQIGYHVTGTNIPANTYVVTVSANQITLSNYVIGSATETLTFRTAGSIDSLTMISAYFDNDGTVPGGDSINTAYGSLSEVYNSTPQGYMGQATGDYVKIANTGAGTMNYAYGSYYDTWATSYGSINNLYGSYNRLRCGVSSGQSPTIYYGYGVANSVEQSYGTLHLAYGFNNKFIGTIGTKFGIYCIGEDSNYLNNKLEINTYTTNTIGLFNVTSGSAIITTTINLINVYAGQIISGPGIPDYTYVVSKDSSTQLTISQNATSTGSYVLYLSYSQTPVNPSGCLLHIVQGLNINPSINIDANGSTAVGSIDFRRNNGAYYSPLALTNNSAIGMITAYGYATTGYSSSRRVGIVFSTSEAWTDTAQGTNITFETTTVGTTTTSEKVRITNLGQVGIGTGNITHQELLDVRGNIAVGGADAGPNYISFHGLTGDAAGSYTSTFIGERLYNGSDLSELFIFKGIENGGNPLTGPDRVRICGGEFRVDTNFGQNYGTFEQCATSVNSANRLKIDYLGNSYFYGPLITTGDFTASAWGVSGIAFKSDSANFTDSSTANSGTVTHGALNSIGGGSILATHTGVIYTNASSLYIASAPVAGTNVSITNPYALYVNSGNSYLAGDLTVNGNFTVNGTTVIINSTTLTVDDKNIELGSIAVPTNTTADGGGITLKGTSDKTIIWDNSNSNWTSSEHWNLSTGKVYKINNVTVLDGTTLGTSIINSSITSVGTLTSIKTSGAMNYNDISFQQSLTLTTTAITQVALDSWASATYCSAKYLVQAFSSTSVHTTEVLVTRDGSGTPNVYINEYGISKSGTDLFTLSVDYSSGNIRLLVTPASATSTVFKVHRILIAA